MPTIGQRMYAAYRAFREPAIISDPLFTVSDDFGDFDNRRLRYNINWAFYENDAYREVRNWSKRYKTEYGLYRWIRSIYNPTYRLGEFWKSHLWGGMLNIDADNDNLIEAISIVRQWSNFDTKKDIVTLYGSIFGDVFLQVIDDIDREKVYLEVVHPGIIKELDLDPFGNVKAYTIEEERESPFRKDQKVEYREVVSRDGDFVIYQTYLNNSPYDWSGNGEEWETPYGFVPMVMIKHNDVGLDWGWSELQPLRSRIHEIDDLVSTLDDYIRKRVASPMLLAGIPNAPSTVPTITHSTNTGTAKVQNPQLGRDEVPNIYAPTGATATSLVSDLDILSVSQHIKDILSDLEENAPELRLSRMGQEASGEKSGKALREARRLSESKVLQRRVNYDDALKRAQQMSVAIGGFRGYFPFSLDSFMSGDLDHEIEDRSVFPLDPLDEMEILEKKFTIGNIPTLSRWRELGYTEQEIQEMLDDKDSEDVFGMQATDLFGRNSDAS